MIAPRHFNPFYSLRLERDQARLATSASRLADQTRLLADSSVLRTVNDAQTIDNAVTAIEGIRGTLQTIANDMASGKIADAKVLVDALVTVLGRRD